MKKRWALGALLCFFSVQVAMADTVGNVVVIGASHGMGREIAREFCRHGYKVGGVGRNQVALQALQDELGANFIFKIADICTDASRDVVKALINELGGCDIFVMNAGIWADLRSEVTSSAIIQFDWDKLLKDQLATIETNIAGFTRMAAVAFEYFINKRKGHFVGISSVDAVRGNPGGPVYSGTKAFESTYMQGWRSAFKQTGFDIAVTDIRPGFIATYDLPGEGQFWVESVEDAGKCIFDAIMDKKKIAYIKARWGLFAGYLSLAPDAVYDYVSSTWGIRKPEGL